MEISDIVYLAFATLVVIIVLHIGVFWVSRMIQPPKPQIVYVDRPVPPTALIPADSTPLPQVVLPPRVEPPPRQTAPPQAPQTLSVPTYADLPLPIVQTSKSEPQLPPPIETRETDKVGWSGGK
jgi:hypothetical protein